MCVYCTIHLSKSLPLGSEVLRPSEKGAVFGAPILLTGDEKADVKGVRDAVRGREYTRKRGCNSLVHTGYVLSNVYPSLHMHTLHNV